MGWKNKKKSELKKKKGVNELVPGYSRKPIIQFLQTKQQKELDKKREIKEIKLKQELFKKAYKEYQGLRNDIDGSVLLKGIVDQDPNVVRYVRLEESPIGEHKPPKYITEESIVSESIGSELGYVRTKISEKESEEKIDDDWYKEYDDGFEEEDVEDELEKDFEEIDPLEYVRTNISSHTEITSRDVKDVLAGRATYFLDNLKDKKTSISDFKIRNTLREEYFIVGRTSISSKKYQFKKISSSATPVYKSKGKKTYRLLLRKNDSLE